MWIVCCLRSTRWGEFVLLRIAEPKSRWAAGKQQYARIDDPEVLSWLVQQMSQLGMEELIWPEQVSRMG